MESRHEESYVDRFVNVIGVYILNLVSRQERNSSVPGAVIKESELLTKEEEEEYRRLRNSRALRLKFEEKKSQSWFPEFNYRVVRGQSVPPMPRIVNPDDD